MQTLAAAPRQRHPRAQKSHGRWPERRRRGRAANKARRSHGGRGCNAHRRWADARLRSACGDGARHAWADVFAAARTLVARRGRPGGRQSRGPEPKVAPRGRRIRLRGGAPSLRNGGPAVARSGKTVTVTRAPNPARRRVQNAARATNALHPEGASGSSRARFRARSAVAVFSARATKSECRAYIFQARAAAPFLSPPACSFFVPPTGTARELTAWRRLVGGSSCGVRAGPSIPVQHLGQSKPTGHV